MANHDIIISGSHMDLTDAIKQTVTEKVEKLYRHEERIIRVRIELGYHPRKNGSEEFTAKGHIEINGPDIHLSETTEDLYKSVDMLVDKLDRKLRQRSRKEKEKRNHPHDVDIDANIPKAQS